MASSLGALLVLAGLAGLCSVWAGATAVGLEPPLVLAQAVLLIAIGLGLALRARAALLLARLGLAAYLLVIGAMIARLSLGSEAIGHPDEQLVTQFHLLALVLAAAVAVALLLLLRRTPSSPVFGAADIVPLAGLAAALVLGIVWLVDDDARLRPCRNGSEDACGALAVALLESAERAPFACPTVDEERTAQVLAGHRCRAEDRGRCSRQRYAVGTVDARAGRLDAAKEAFLWACDADRSWCARAAQQQLTWTAAEHKRLLGTPSRSK